MATIVFFSIPAQGHVHPTLGVVRELTARGHRVIYYSYEGFREKIRAAGGEFVGCERLDPTMGLTRQAGARVGSDLALSTRVLVDTLLALDEPVCREMERLRPGLHCGRVHGGLGQNCRPKAGHSLCVLHDHLRL